MMSRAMRLRRAGFIREAVNREIARRSKTKGGERAKTKKE